MGLEVGACHTADDPWYYEYYLGGRVRVLCCLNIWSNMPCAAPQCYRRPLFGHMQNRITPFFLSGPLNPTWCSAQPPLAGQDSGAGRQKKQEK